MKTERVEEYDGRKSPGAFSTKSGRYKSTISLHELNNRLAGYIDKVRTLQRDNAKLTKQIKHIEEYQSKEVNNVKHIYDAEIESLKDALDALSKQYNQLKVASEGL